MTNTIYIHQPEKAFSFTRLPNFLFEAPTFQPLSNEAKVLYAGLVEIQKQGCGKPNRIYPKSYEAVPNTDFKKSGYGTPEG